jgi:hypothetical protein
MSDRICEFLASGAVIDSQAVVQCRGYAANRKHLYDLRLFFDQRAAAAEASMIDRANRIIARLERQA